ncbi:membrane-bound lytic murein transglycosylase MltF [Mycolicibacterium fluoranthenivorans]|uniref:Membrane-bound lytic murein transglycosylase MltF n=1 Tax=Mycolicibacterium fluoranthenivorans TaxID=258505 RepID=A0A7X5U5Q3_9MYCO|nr:membrane-bound lytic murein transglycosylase MltF [Mycolicibacterium fluoranthenivorans]
MAGGADSSPGVGASASLNAYWTSGEGRAKWASSPKPWTTLYTLLRKYMSDAKAKGLATEYFVRVFGHGPGAHH